MFNFKSIHNYKLFLKTNKLYKKIVFYSEGENYDHFYNPYINVCINENIPFSYISSEEKIPFKLNSNSKFFYIGKSFIRTLFFLSLECDNLITTTPDINNFYLKKSVKCKNYIYFFHSMCSTNVIYNHNAFSHYDTILSANKFHSEEFKDYFFSNMNKKVINLGYPKIDELISSQKYQNDNLNIKSILIAPTWGDEKNTYNSYNDIISILLKNNYNITFRPHPVTLIKFKKYLSLLEKNFSQIENFKISYEKDNSNDYNSNDLILSDWSGSAIEFAIAYKKPCIFLNSRQKIRNRKSTINQRKNSFENFFRKSIAKTIDNKNISEILNYIDDKDNLIEYSTKIDLFREKYLYNFQNTNEAIKKFIKSIS
jgi:YidC/Oxa1 family membrane protein insertase